MNYAKVLIRGAVALGIVVSGTATLSAQDWRSHELNQDRRELRQDHNDVTRDRSRLAGVQTEIARDRSRLDNDIRMGRQRAASADARELARDQRELEFSRHNMSRDQREVRQDRRDLGRDYYGNERRW